MSTHPRAEDESLVMQRAQPSLPKDALSRPAAIPQPVPEVLGALAPDALLALPAAIYLTDPDGRITFYNQAAVDMWGVRPQLGKSEWCGSWRLYWPDGRPRPHNECPMAVALRTRQAVRGAEAIAERPDGTRVPFLAYPTPLFDATGAMVGAVNMLIDTSDQTEIERAQQLLAAIVESSDDAIVSKDLTSIVRTWNRAAERLFGYTAEEMIGQPITRLIPAEMQNEETEILRRIRAGERLEHYDTVRRRKDGTLVDVSLTVSPVRNRRGEIVGASKIARDVSEQRRAQEQQRLLLREMNHRIRNLFALAGGLVTLTARYAKTPADMASSIRERLGALSRAHELTLPRVTADGDTASQPTTLDALLRTIVTPYVDSGQDVTQRIVVDGPEVVVGGSAVTSFALLLHEIATNAAKYGALSSPSGRVVAKWRIEGEELDLTWREEGGPPVAGEPERTGFGSTLAEATVLGQFGGKISREWRSEGLIVHLTILLDRLEK